MPRGKWVLFDTNVYVAALREGVRGAAFARIRESAPRTFLASVVSAELRAGAVDQTGRSVVLELTDRFDRLGRVVTPEARSWSLAGDVLGDIRRREPGMRDKIARLWNDALIALSPARSAPRLSPATWETSSCCADSSASISSRSRARLESPAPSDRSFIASSPCLPPCFYWLTDQFRSARIWPVTPKVGVGPVRREQIVQATIRCLAREGYAGLTMKKVAREAAVSQGILHYYFASKRAILIAALDVVMGDLDRRVAALSEGARDARGRLRAVIRGCLGLAEDSREFWVVFVEFWGEMMHDQEMSRINAALYERLRRTLGATVALGTREGVFRRVDPVEAGAVILALVDGLSLQRTFDARALTLERAARACEDAVSRYLAKA